MSSKPSSLENCDIFCSNPALVEQIKERLENLNVMVDIFKAMGDETRFKIIYALWHEEQLCVCDLALVVNMPVAAVSYHLRYLRSLRLVRSDKQGKMVFYRLDDCHIKDLVSIVLAHSREEIDKRRN